MQSAPTSGMVLDSLTKVKGSTISIRTNRSPHGFVDFRKELAKQAPWLKQNSVQCAIISERMLNTLTLLGIAERV